MSQPKGMVLVTDPIVTGTGNGFDDMEPNSHSIVIQDDEATMVELTRDDSGADTDVEEEDSTGPRSRAPPPPILPPTPRRDADSFHRLIQLSAATATTNGSTGTKSKVFDYSGAKKQTHLIETYNDNEEAHADTSVTCHYGDGQSEFSRVGEDFASAIESDAFSQTVNKLLEHTNMDTVQKSMLWAMVRRSYVNIKACMNVTLMSYRSEIACGGYKIDQYDTTLQRMKSKAQNEDAVTYPKNFDKLMKAYEGLLGLCRDTHKAHEHEKAARLALEMKMGFVEQVMNAYLDTLSAILKDEKLKKTTSMMNSQRVESEESKKRAADQASKNGCLLQ